MSKQVFLQLPSEVRIPPDCDFQPNEMQIASAARRAMHEKYPTPRPKYPLWFQIVCLATPFVVAYLGYLIWEVFRMSAKQIAYEITAALMALLMLAAWAIFLLGLQK